MSDMETETDAVSVMDEQKVHPFYVTFGSQYRQEDHPFFEGAHPDGYVVIEAPDELTARYVAFGIFDQAWSMIYAADEFDITDPENMRWYPLGELGRITINFETKPGRGRKR